MAYTCRKCKCDNLLTDEVVMKNGGYILCKKCISLARKDYYSRTKEIKKEIYAKSCRESFLKFKYGTSEEEYRKLLELQLGGCAICKQPCKSGNRLAIDHNHKTNEIRGLLCHNCNVALGLMNEDENLIWNMLEYLKRTTWSKVA